MEQMSDEKYILALKTHFGIVRNISVKEVFVEIVGKAVTGNIYHFRYLDKDNKITGIDGCLERIYNLYYGDNREYNGWK